MRMIISILAALFLVSTLMVSMPVTASEADADNGDSTKVLTAEEKRKQEQEKRADRENWRAERRMRMIKEFEPSGKGDYKKVNDYIKQFAVKYNFDPRLWHFDVTAEAKKDKIYLKGSVQLEQMKQGVVDLLKMLGFETIIADDVMVLPDPALRENVFGLVSVPVLGQYKDVNDKRSRLNEYTYGTGIQILKKSEDKKLAYIQGPEGYLGWVSMDGVREADQKEWQRSKLGPFAFMQVSVVLDPETGEVKKTDWNLEEKDLENLVALPKSSLQVLNDKGEIVLVDGKTVGIDKSFYTVQNPAKDPRRDVIVDIAKSFTGTPYVWGGVSDQGIDCSGFTQAAYRGVGIPLSRDASQQVIGGEIVGSCATMAAALPGDLIYFGGRNGRISHTGLYLGNGRFIHASGEPGVAESSFNPADADYNNYLHNRVVWVRRFLR